jgi:hypothetical protein
LALKNRLVALYSALIKAHAETDNSPHSVIYRPVGSTKQCFLKNSLTSRRPSKILPLLTFLVLYKGRTPFLRKRSLPDGPAPSRGQRAEPNNGIERFTQIHYRYRGRRILDNEKLTAVVVTPAL